MTELPIIKFVMTFIFVFNIYYCKLFLVNMRINATRMTTPIEEKVDQKLKIRTGMVTVSDGKSRPVPVLLHLSMEVLRLQKEEIVPPETKPQNAKVGQLLFVIRTKSLKKQFPSRLFSRLE